MDGSVFTFHTGEIERFLLAARVGLDGIVKLISQDIRRINHNAGEEGTEVDEQSDDDDIDQHSFIPHSS